MGGPAWTALSLPSNCVLAAYALGDMIMLKPIDIPTENDFKASLDQFASWPRMSDIRKATWKIL